MAAGGGRRSRSRSPAVCGCCGDPQARRRRRRTQGRRTVSCGCPAADAADDSEGGSHRYWSGSPPRTPPDWRDSFQQLRRRWSDEARRRSTRRGSQDRQRPSNPSPGEIRALSGSNRPGAQPEYAASGPDPAPWTPEAQAASAPTLQQRLAELQRWQDATLRVSVEAVQPSSGSHFSLAACWDPDSSPNTHVSSTGSPLRRGSAIGPAPVVEVTVSSSSAASQTDVDSVTEESDDSEEDALEHVWEEVDDVLQESPIDKDATRAEVESILRASTLSQGEKFAVINAALEESSKGPEEKRETAKSMLRRSTPGVREVSDTDDPEREVSRSHVRRSSAGRRSSRGSRVRSLVEEFEAEGTRERRVSGSRRGSRKSTVRRETRKSTRIEDAGGRATKGGTGVRWKSITLAPADSRKSSTRASAASQRQSQAARKSELHEELGSVFGKSVGGAPKSVYYEGHSSVRPSQRRSTRRSSPSRAGSSVLREARSSTRTTGNWSMEARHGSRASDYDSGESEDEVRTSHRYSSTPRTSRVPRQSHYRRSTAASSVHHDDELRPTRSLSTRRPTGWARRSSIVDTEEDEWATPRRSAEDSFHSAVDDTSRHSHRRSSRRSTHEPPVSDIEEYSSEEETMKSTSRTSVLEEGDPAERQRWSSRRRDDDEDDEGGAAAGGSVQSQRPSGRKSSARRSTYFDAEQSPHPRKKSSKSGTEERDAHCCCVAGDHASCPALTPSGGSKRCVCARSDRLASASDVCCCRGRAARQAAGMGDMSSGSSECCCCRSWGATTTTDDSWDECSCYCDSVRGSAPELTHVCRDDDAWERGTCWEAPARKGGLRKRDLEVDLCSECRLQQEATKKRATCREVCPAVRPCKSALGWTKPTCTCDRPLPQKKKCKPQIVAKKAPAVQPRCGCWRRRLVRYGPCVLVAAVWLLCVWWLCGMLRPLFFPDRCRATRCNLWGP